MSQELDVEQYTKNEAFKTLVAIEEHLASFSNAPMFCTACLRKHFSYLEILAEECFPAQCTINPVLKIIREWAISLKNNLENLDEKKIEEIAIQAREFRKRIEEEPVKHLTG